MEISIGELLVIRDGTIACSENDPIDFIISKDDQFIVRVIFSKNSEWSDARTKVDRLEPNGLLLTFFNFNSPSGTGNIDPVLVGKVKNQDLYLNYRVYSLSQGGKTFHYTWFVGKEGSNG